MDDLAGLSAHLADTAGVIARQYFRHNPLTEYKDDATPVTLADREIERALRAIIEQERPDDGISGEEFGVKASKNGYCWVIDPIDGTTAFMTGRPLFATLIGLMQEDEFLLGVIDQPISKERWIGQKNAPSLFNGQEMQTRNTTDLGKAIIGSTGPSMFRNDVAYENLRAKTKFTIWGGDAYNYALLASGHMDLVVEARLKLHDYAALVPVIEGAGGVITDWGGTALHSKSDGRVIAAATHELHQQAIEILEQS